jgi:hypothetical protein
VISAELTRGSPLLLVAPVRGVTAEAERAVAALDAFGPHAVGLGLSAEELRGLTDYFVLAEAEPIVPLTPAETSEVRGLVRFGEVRVPNPSFVRVVAWGRARALPVEPLDPSDERSASLFAEHIGYVELVRRTVREHRVARSPPSPSTPDEYALAWDREVAPGRGSRAFARARDRHLVRGVARLTEGRSRVAVVVDRERFDPVRRLLEQGLTSEMGDE